MSQPNASVQLIIFGQRGQDDLPGVLGEIADAGYSAFEGGNLFASHGEEKIRHLLDAHQLCVSRAHFGYGDYADPIRLKEHITYAKQIGLKNLMCSGVSDSKTSEGYKQSARLFNAVGKQLADEGLTFNYHNHAWEFDDLGSLNGMQILDAETDPDLVKYNLDVFWLYYAGVDPISFIEAHPNRTGYFHFKDGSKSTDTSGKSQPVFAELGRGKVDLPAAYQAAMNANVQWIVVEQDNTRLSPLESITISRRYLHELGV